MTHANIRMPSKGCVLTERILATVHRRIIPRHRLSDGDVVD